MKNRHTPHLARHAAGALLLAVFSFILLYLAQSSRTFADWYSDYIYTFLVNTVGRFFGIFPFSVAEAALYLAILLLAGSFLWMLRHSTAARWKRYGTDLLMTTSILFFSYTVCCGINYGRASFSESTGMQTIPYTAQELTRVCEYLTGQVNRLAEQVPRNADGTADIGEDVPARARSAMTHLGTIYDRLDGFYPEPKGLTFPVLLSVQNLSGIYAPFTIEANYNSAMTGYNLPFTACHELSHLRGFMQEEEANFIGFLACIRSDDDGFRYSGYLLGWLYATNQLYRADYEKYQEIYAMLDDKVLADLAANREFWNQYDGRIAEVSNQINDNYLKANGQNDGVQSYDRMVDLMMVYYQDLKD